MKLLEKFMQKSNIVLFHVKLHNKEKQIQAKEQYSSLFDVRKLYPIAYKNLLTSHFIP